MRKVLGMVSMLLLVVTSVSVSAASWLWLLHQPKVPKSLLK